ncbi:hypothetical protein GWO43_04720 [candidate division KSB1 bacterium]|nr:hypothetical protein [candidate division KSB1 bacterium]NIR71218.1 hypothetical protein [candidate division KSB1 bacterium]NIS23322.1 hypothetical protein [candidate division KSB1 bacterium]NIT70201.1 hypothetical protein [candidate division KSB1 bacterium]NIU23853.1 hypothetical protein [candidate division KSB1 bacterium]
MSLALYTLVGIAFLVALFFGLRKLIRTYLTFRGKMLVTCPETNKPAGVEVDAGHAAIMSAMGEEDLHLKACTRWPEREDCGQECLSQIESSPENCLVRMILTDWYKDKTCVYCRKAFGEIHWHDHKPALLAPNKITVEWQEIPVEKLPRMLSTHKPVCWNCHIAETFRRAHPDLVIDRPANRSHLL